MKCFNCQFVNSSGRTLCINCGRSVVPLTPNDLAGSLVASGLTMFRPSMIIDYFVEQRWRQRITKLAEDASREAVLMSNQIDAILNTPLETKLLNTWLGIEAYQAWATSKPKSKKLAREGISVLSRAIYLDPTFGPTHYLRALLLGFVSRHSEALEDVTLAIEYGKNDAEAYAFRALQCGMLGKRSERLADARKALSLDPNNELARNMLSD